MACRCAGAAARPAAGPRPSAEGRVTSGPDGAGLRLDVGSPQPGAATVTLSRPQRRNAMTPGMWRGLAAIGRSLPPEVRVVVIRGEGPAFSAGIDLRLLGGEE